MLTCLRVRQLAIIDELEVDFGPGLNVVTGETGAGKSILIAALGLVPSSAQRAGSAQERRPPQPRPTSGPPSSMAKTPSRLKHTSPMATSSPASFFFDEVSMMVGQERPANSSEVVSLFGSQPMSRTFLPCCAII